MDMVSLPCFLVTFVEIFFGFCSIRTYLYTLRKSDSKVIFQSRTKRTAFWKDALSNAFSYRNMSNAYYWVCKTQGTIHVDTAENVRPESTIPARFSLISLEFSPSANNVASTSSDGRE